LASFSSQSDVRFIVKEATSKDSLALGVFFELNAQIFHSGEASFTKYIDEYLKQPNSLSFVAVALDEALEGPTNTRVIGFANIQLIKRPRGGQMAYLGEVLVSKSWRARGVARALVNLAVSTSRSSKCHKVVLHCPSYLINFYKEIGFSVWDLGMSITFPNE
jgi:predicted GNAT family N-acyltransferase